ncbi:MAG: hypothetical protein BWY83_01376 [bacterium ADurb.Bin478]|nr:MAG: hypothetical protein BWY83_01376 [bacterium ADurb.Bin478]
MDAGHAFHSYQRVDDLHGDVDALHLRILGLLHSLHIPFIDADAGHLLHVPHRLDRFERQHSGEDHGFFRQSPGHGLLQPAAEQFEIEHRLSLDKARAGLYFFIQSDQTHLQRLAAGIGRGADEKIRRFFHLMAGEEQALIHMRHSGDELNGIEIEHAFGFGLIAKGRIVAGHAKQIVQAESGGAEQIALHGQAVAVTAGHLHDRFHPFVQQDFGRRDARQPGDGRLIVGDVDRIHQPLEIARFFADHIAVAALRWADLAAQNQLFGFNLFFEGQRG